MKIILTIFFVAAILAANGQKKNHGFLLVGPEYFMNDDFGSRPGIGATFGSAFGNHFALGADISAYVFKDNPKFGVAHGNITTWLNGITKPIAAFIAVNPGVVIHKETLSTSGNSVYDRKGGFSLDVMSGVKFKFKKDGTGGATFSIGYSEMTFKYKDQKDKFSGLKIRLCYSIG